MASSKRSWLSRVALSRVALLLTFAACAGHAEEPATAALSAETRALIVQEMQAIDSSMAHIHAALVTGDHERIQREARAMHDSFVLQQALRPEQRAEIMAMTPAFIDMDRAFHALAGRLADAADARDPALERFWFQELTRACQSCHADHARARFPGLREPSALESHGH
jgi:hypothetical protein